MLSVYSEFWGSDFSLSGGEEGFGRKGKEERRWGEGEIKRRRDGEERRIKGKNRGEKRDGDGEGGEPFSKFRRGRWINASSVKYF